MVWPAVTGSPSNWETRSSLNFKAPEESKEEAAEAVEGVGEEEEEEAKEEAEEEEEEAEEGEGEEGEEEEEEEEEGEEAEIAGEIADPLVKAGVSAMEAAGAAEVGPAAFLGFLVAHPP